MCSITSVIHNTSNTLSRIRDYAGLDQALSWRAASFPRVHVEPLDGAVQVVASMVSAPSASGSGPG